MLCHMLCHIVYIVNSINQFLSFTLNLVSGIIINLYLWEYLAWSLALLYLPILVQLFVIFSCFQLFLLIFSNTLYIICMHILFNL